REIFKRARQTAPTVIFFDEIDSIAPMRGMGHDSGVTERMVNQLLSEMDGIVPLSKVVVIAATNRPDIIDPGLLRPGRFDRLIYVPPPDKQARLEILKVHTKSVPLAPDVDLNALADKTEGYTGADLEALVREATMISLRQIYSNCSGVTERECKAVKGDGATECYNKTMKECIESNTPKVSAQNFDEAMKIVTPSLTKAQIDRYEKMAKELKRSALG
ncbi:MAG: AAA family ATPase, partial [Metallosphaera sp.]